jgi:hypothetical protein
VDDAVEMVFLSYDEPRADELFLKACRVLGDHARPMRLHGVHGVARAYRLTAEITEGDWYLLVDGDCLLHQTILKELVSARRRGTDKGVFIWRSRNPVNGLEYGYGGPKLVHKDAFRAIDPTRSTDPLSQVEPLWFLDKVVCDTQFNQSEFHAWRAGVREVTSLRANAFGMDLEERRRRIKVWTTIQFPVEYASWAVVGAQYAEVEDLAVEFGDPLKLAAIFERLYPSVRL